MSRGLLRNALIVFALALTVRWTADVVLNPHLDPSISDEYDIIAQNMLDGHGFSYRPGESIPTVTRAPFYPLWLAAELAVFGRNFLLMRMAEGLVDAVTAALVVFMAAAFCRLPLGRGPPTTASIGTPTRDRHTLLIPTLAGAVYAVQPFSIYYAAKMGTETWFTFWLVLVVWAFVAWVLAPGYRSGAVLGVVAGVLLLNKSTAIGLLIVLAVPGVIWLRGRRALACLSLALCFVIAGVIVTPWLVRDYRVADRHFVAVQTMMWWNFWADFDFSSSGWTNTIESHYAPEGGPAVWLSAPADVRQEARLQHQAVQWMTAHPLAMLGKMGRNLVEFWYLVDGVGRAQITAVAMTIEVLIAIAGAWLAWRERRRRLLLLAIIVILYFNLVYTPIIAHVRYSLVVVPWLCLLQAFLLAWIYGRVMRRHAD